MKKRILCGIAALVMFFCLSGCFSAEEKYDTEAADQIAAKGTARMEAWLEENMPDAELWTFGNWLEADGIELWGMAYKRTERRDTETGELVVSDLQVDPEKDLTFEKTDFGYRLSLHNKDLYDRLMLRAHEGAEILTHTYYCLDEADYDPDQDLSETADRTFWQDWGGTFVLTDSAAASARWLYDGDLLVRME